VYSAAITAWLARGRPLEQAVELAKNHITGVIANPRLAIGGAWF
jgi:hydroxymethylpyrimidine/phosphomethylpyrimidine kinase